VTTTQNRDKFATYFRDSSGLDYALNRYYSSSHGRFLTPDPYVASASLTNPQSWNRYPYVENDPVNYHDPGGLLRWVPTPFPRLPETTNTTTVVRTREGDILNQPGDGVPDAEETEGEESDGWDPIQSALAVARNAATFIENKGDWSAQCEKTLGAVGTSVAGLQEAAANVSIVEGNSSTTQVAELYANAAVPRIAQLAAVEYKGVTVGQFMAKNLGTTAMAQLGGNRVFISTNWFNHVGTGYAVGTMAHELLHNITGHVDSDLQKTMGLSGVSGDSRNITLRLLADCFM